MTIGKLSGEDRIWIGVVVVEVEESEVLKRCRQTARLARLTIRLLTFIHIPLFQLQPRDYVDLTLPLTSSNQILPSTLQNSTT